MARTLKVLAARPVTVTKTGKVKSAHTRRKKKKNAGPQSFRKLKKRAKKIAARLGTSIKLKKRSKNARIAKGRKKSKRAGKGKR